MAYYAAGSFGSNQYNPFATPSTSGGFFGSHPVGPDAFKTADPLGGGSAYYDTANDGKAGLEQFVGSTLGGNNNSGNRFGNYVRNNYGNLWNQFGAAEGKDPSLTWTGYLSGQQGNLQQSYANQNAYDKGEQGQKKLSWL